MFQSTLVFHHVRLHSQRPDEGPTKSTSSRAFSAFKMAGEGRGRVEEGGGGGGGGRRSNSRTRLTKILDQIRPITRPRIVKYFVA